MPVVADAGVTEPEVVDSTSADNPVAAPVTVAARIAAVHPAFWATLLASFVFTVVFGRLAVLNHRNFGTWAFDMGIYDQGFWLLSRGKAFITVRGIHLWGHHINLVAVLFVPFYWLGAGPQFLVVVQAFALGVGAVPVYLIARDRFRTEWLGLVFALAYLFYAPVQWITSANFHPEALVVSPLLYAWWFGRQRRWRGCLVALVLALSTREDTALAVVVLGLALWWSVRRETAGEEGRRDRRVALTISLIGAIWYVAATKLVIPLFNRGEEPFYVRYFYSRYGSNMVEVAGRIVRQPDWVVSDATQPDRLRFYRDLLLPYGGLPLTGPLQLLIAGPQMLASVIGSSPYARMIRFQYTSVMIAPITIAAIEGSARLWHRFAFVRRALIPWLLVCAYVSNVAWSPSPLGAGNDVWARSSPRHAVMREAVSLVPDGASVTATYQLGPHLSHREHIYDWPNPWVPAYWGNDDTYRLPDPSTIDYLVVDRQQVGPDHQQLFSSLIDSGGEFEILLDRDDVVVARRR